MQARGFDGLSPFYDLIASSFSFNTIWRSQAYFLSHLGNYSSVLILGGGTGRILQEMMKRSVSDNYVYVDCSAKMIKRSRRRVKDDPRVHFICGTEDDIPPGKNFDLIVTPYVLDCFNEKQLGRVMKVLDARLSPGGKWFFTDFVKKGIITRSLYLFFRATGAVEVKSLPDFEKQFELFGYRTEAEKYFLGRLLATRIYSRK